MAATRAVLFKSGPIADVGTIDSPCLFWAVRGTLVRFLFERPSPFWLAEARRAAAS